MLPMVTCVCPTYGRYPDFGHLVEEAVESFLRQDYQGQKELIIVNDCFSQSLSLPGALEVRILNVGGRFASLGAKYNWGFDHAEGDIFLTWEDDDISLPRRITQAVERLASGEYHYFNPQRSWFLAKTAAGLEGVGLHHHHNHGVCHNASAFTRAAFRVTGGYPSVSGNQDALMDARLKALDRTAPPLSNDPAKWTYIYRWGVSNCHLSGSANHEDFYRDWGKRVVSPGAFTIRPHWRADYVRLTNAALLGR